MPEDERPNTVLPGIVEKIIKPVVPGEPEKAQIAVETADHLYREIRIENKMTTPDGQEVGLKSGAEVEVIIAADAKDTVKKA